jgi:hypothetical protein
MELLEAKLTKEDFNKAKWEDVIKDCSEKDCYIYATEFLKKAREAHQKGEIQNEAIFTLLSFTSSLILKSDSGDTIFAIPSYISPQDNSALDALKEHHINVLQEIVPEIQDAELQARIADILWVKNRSDYRFAQLAVDAYIKSAENLEDPKHWPKFVKRLERVADISRQLGKESGHFIKTMSYLELIIKKYYKTDPLYLTVKCMEIMQKFEQGDFLNYAAIAGEVAERMEQGKDFDKAKTYWLAKSEWHRLAKDPAGMRDARIKAAETQEKFAYLHLAGKNPSYTLASYRMNQAIQALRKIEGTNDKVENLHKKLLEYQEKSLSEMASINLGPIDYSDTAIAVQNAVKGKSFHEAIFVMAFQLFNPLIYDEIQNRVKKIITESPMQMFATGSLIDSAGRTIAKSKSPMSPKSDSVEHAILCQMYKHCSEFHYGFSALSIIEPARQQIYIEHDVRVRDWLTFTRESEFVPEGREYICARALHAGFNADPLVSVHLIVPQIEHSLRYLLNRQGIITSALNDEGIQEERDINELLYIEKYRVSLEELLGKDIVFHLQGLLISRFGCNLRNRIAHGLLDDQQLYSYDILYLWWFYLRLCLWLVPAINAQLHKMQRDATVQNNKKTETKDKKSST